MKLYLVWSEAKNECFGTDDELDAYYAANGEFPEGIFRLGVSTLADHFYESYGEEECTIQEIEV